MKYDQMAIQLLIDNAPQSELTKLAEMAERHIRIIIGKECPYCQSQNTVSNEKEGWCKKCNSGWLFDEYQTIDPIEAKRGNIVPAALL